MGHLRISLLGTFQATLDGRSITNFESDKVRALLAYLAVESERPHRREKMAGLLWPERPERSARRNLSQALFNLRGAIGDASASPPFLSVTRQSLQFNRSSDHDLDVTALTARVATCEKHPHPRLSACDSCLEKLEEGVALYRGEFLAGFSLSCSPAFEEWSLLQGERLYRLAVQTSHRLADSWEERGEKKRALYHARRRVELDPWREAAHRQLMRLLALSGQREAALAQYEACRHVLATELGLAPGPETIALYERIRAKSQLRAWTPPHNLPTPLTAFIGRKTELVEIGARLQDPDCRLLTLVGPGGSGKSRLALEAAQSQINSFHHGIYFIPLAPLSSTEALVPTIAETLGFSSRAGDDPLQQLLNYLRAKRMLLVLDNFEHLLRGATLVTRILQSAPGVKILVTSRTRLKVQGEHLLTVTGMTLPDEPTPENADRSDAVQLFLNSAQRIAPGCELTPDNVSDVVTVCRLAQGMPLAILLAAGWVATLSPGEIAAEIRHSTDFLETDLRDVPERQRSLRAVFDHSWRLLTPQEQALFQALSVFRGGFAREAAQQITAASLRDLRGFVEKSLLHCRTGPSVGLRTNPSTGLRTNPSTGLRTNPSTGLRTSPSTGLRTSPSTGLRTSAWYEMHELLRQYAAEKLNRTPAEGQAIRNRHAAYYSAKLQAWAADLKGPRQRTALAALEENFQNIRSAWEWAAAHAQVKQLAQALDGLCLFFEWRGRHQEGEAACWFAAEKLTGATSGAALQLRAKILTWQSVFSRRQGPGEPAARLLEQSDAILDRAELATRDLRAERAAVLLRRGRLSLDADRERARTLFEKSLQLYQTLGDRWGMAQATSALGGLAWNLGDYPTARRLHRQRLEILQALGAPREIARALLALGVTSLFQGSLKEGECMIREAGTILQEAGDRVGIADGHRNLGLALLFLGRFAEADAALEKSLVIYNDLGFRYGLETSMLGCAKLHRGQYAAARAQAQKGLALSRGTGYPRGIALSLLVLGQVALVEKAYAEARPLLQESADIYSELGQREKLALALADLGVAAQNSGAPYQAQTHVRRALQTAAKIQAPIPLVATLSAIAQLLAEGAARPAHKTRATEIYALAARYPHVSNSRWFQDTVGSAIAALTAGLSSDAVAAAQTRGRICDLEATAEELLSELEKGPRNRLLFSS